MKRLNNRAFLSSSKKLGVLLGELVQKKTKLALIVDTI